MSKNIPKKTHKLYLKLLQELKKHDEAYFVLNQPTVSDEEYDTLFNQLKKIEELHPDLILPGSPTQRVGGEALDFFKKEKHKIPMLSLENAFSFEEVQNFEERTKKRGKTEWRNSLDFALTSQSHQAVDESKAFQDFLMNNPLTYYCEPKLDGLAIELIYEKGVLVKALTRGDGKVGENVTSNVKTLRSLPLRLKTPHPPDVLEVRGEILMFKKDFEKLNKIRETKGEEPFSNPRNLVAGTIRQLNPKEAEKRRMRIFCYASGWKKKDKKNKAEFQKGSQKQFMTQIKDYGLPILSLAPHWNQIDSLSPSCLCSSLKEVKLYHQRVEQQRSSWPFYIDGIVVKVNSFVWQELLGTSNKGPRWALAFKFKSKKMETQVKDILLSVGRTGVVTPVARLKPVWIDGVKVEHATLHNQNEIQRKDIRIGDHVLVYRAGEVIPALLSVLKKKRPLGLKAFQMPKHCPSCSQALEQNKDNVDIRCTNSLCPSVIRQSLKHFVSKKAMNISQLGQKSIDLLVEKRQVKKPSDLYKLKLEDWTSLEGFALKSSQKILKSLQESLRVELAYFIYAWGVPHMGEIMTQSLAYEFSDLNELVSQTNNKDFRERLLSLEFFGEKVVESLICFLKQKSFLNELKEFKNLGLKIQNSFYKRTQNKKPLPLKNLSIAITGSFPLEREKIKRKIQDLGGHYSSRLNSKTNFLLCSQQRGKKFDQARELNISLINWEEFQAWIERGQKPKS